ncbi:acyl-CoA thioesterase [Ferrimonas marina]|uniref:Acyl-CoA thioesterase FadM n=1 Tax=Ferrimonas marina TaxID=299255 RepID=A0A1M5YDN7_9GAMM|nr:acyl-CoA thioesterase [Ferrimonas marina]SHI10147.1 Acyl-CoA thioesterase FadM [Ferrimonas marina]
MYPLFRLLTCTLGAMRANPLHADATGSMSFRCRPWDLDLFMEMNNGRILTLYDLGRFDFSIRTGLMKALKKNRWGLVVAGSTVRYRRRIRLWDKVTIKTRVVGMDERWLYVKQSMWVKGEACSSVLLRTGITERGRVIEPRRVIDAVGLEDWQPTPSDWPKAWIDSEALRPWPPQV